uniref:Uncharacterized protein n=1 Tax=Sinocyclocheilus anshuiensis TaxID=1608454 RepID=A0A671SCI7_9TELE
MPANYSYMVALGIDFATQKMARMLKPQKFEEITKGLDNRKYQSTGTIKLVCVQKGEKKNRGWTHWMEGDTLYLELRCEDQICKQTYERTAYLNKY